MEANMRAQQERRGEQYEKTVVKSYRYWKAELKRLGVKL